MLFKSFLAEFKYCRTLRFAMKTAHLLILLTLSSFAFAATISDFPSMFTRNGNFSAVYVIGEKSAALDVVSATVISTGITRYNLTTAVGTSRLDTEIGDITLHDAIIIGSPCENKAAAQLEGNPNPCFANLGGSAGYIKVFEHNGKQQLLITGLTPEDRHQAARFLARENLASLKVSSFIIPTSTGSKPAYFSQLQTNTSQTAPVNITAANTTTSPPAPTINTSANKTKTKPPVGAYEPLDEIPRKKSWFERFLGWIKRIFT